MQIPKKSLGQNFLLDKNIQKKIVSIIDIKDKNIIEIGPGTGQITNQIILKKPKELILIEKDDELSNFLKKKYLGIKNIIIFNDDILLVKFKSRKNYNLISNLPYNLSVKIIINTLINYDNIDEMIFMVQKEVAKKMNKNNKMNKLNFFIQVLTEYKIIFDISNNVFYPKPKIQSSVIKITPKKLDIDKKKLWEFSKLIFKNKRKKIRNIIDIKNPNLDFRNLIEKRAEDLTIKNLLYLFKNF